MALDERYLTALDLEEFFVDNTSGEPLAGGTIEFWKDNDRATPKNVYQLSGSPPNYTYSVLPNPVTLSGVGTVVNGALPPVNVAIYYYPYDENGNIELYYIIVKDSSGTVQLRREGWPHLTESNDPTKTENSISNELSNPQFVDVLFDPLYGTTITTTGAVSNQVYEIAPNWDVILSTSGIASVTINRTSVAGSSNLPTNPSYTLNILAGGGSLSSLRLRQRLSNNPDIWANDFVAGHMVVSSIDGSPHTLTMIYAPSVAAAETIIVSGSTGATGYQELSATIALDAGTNTDTSAVGYVDIILELPVSGQYNVTSVQVVGVSSNEQGVTYDQETANRQRDHLFNYYNPLLQYKPIPSYLIGWDFGFNPAQFGSTGTLGVIGAGKSKYVWDQTIVYQSAANSVSYSRHSSGSLSLQATSTTQIAVVQYLRNREKLDLMLHDLSVFLRAVSSQALGINGTISLWRTTDASLPDLKAANYNSIVATLDANGKPSTTNGNWTEIPRGALGDARFSLDSTIFNEYGFTGWDALSLTDASASTYFAIVIGFESMDAGQFVFLNNIGLTPGKIPTQAPATSFSEEISKCERYYELSYAQGTIAGTATTVDIMIANLPQHINSGIYSRSFQFDYRQSKWKDPTVTFYSSIGTAANIEGMVLRAGAVQSGPINRSIATFTVTPGQRRTLVTPLDALIWASTGANNGNEMLFRYHYQVEARLGII